MQQKYLIPRYEFIAESYEELLEKSKKYLNRYHIFTDECTVEVVDRTTVSGFNMRFHRDDYRFDENSLKKGINDDSLWIPIYNIKRPFITAIWYRSTQGIDFNGGNLKFFDGHMVRPVKNNVILFDSNDLHQVTLQTTKPSLTNQRVVKIIKFYS